MHSKPTLWEAFRTCCSFIVSLAWSHFLHGTSSVWGYVWNRRGRTGGKRSAAAAPAAVSLVWWPCRFLLYPESIKLFPPWLQRTAAKTHLTSRPSDTLFQYPWTFRTHRNTHYFLQEENFTKWYFCPKVVSFSSSSYFFFNNLIICQHSHCQDLVTVRSS